MLVTFFNCNICSALLLLLLVAPCACGRAAPKSLQPPVNDYCTSQCSTRQHTLCVNYQESANATCAGHSIDVRHYKTVNIRQLLVHGHNGLRNRIARRMQVANMVEVTWSNVLEQMAIFYMNLCTPEVNDECTEFTYSLAEGDIDEPYLPDEFKLIYVVQNRYCQHSEYLPNNFVEQSMRAWYYEKDGMQAPGYRQYSGKAAPFGILQGENNFTHLAYPLVAYFGCGMRNYGKYFCLMCNYYPYHRFESTSMLYRTGPPTTQCPAVHPLKHAVFPELCTGGHHYERDAAAMLPRPRHYKAPQFAILLLFFYYCLLFAFLL